MLAFDNSRLRAQVICDYRSVARHVTTAEQMNHFVNAVVTNASRAVRDMLNVFNQANFMARMPPKALSVCFAHLPLRYLIAASQVCRAWREAAISQHSLWSRIHPDSLCYDPGLLKIALSRAGALPIDLAFDRWASTARDAIYAAIAPFSRQIRYLSWPGDQPTRPWDFPAPNLECFCASETLAISDAFLGGCAGRLRYMYLQYVHLPAVCPALSTVTELSVASTPFEEAPSSLRNLFDLFPQLGCLTITGITRRGAAWLPTGTAPASLWGLFLQCRSTDYDLMPHCLEWDSGHFHRVSLKQCSGSRPNLDRFARGAVTLAFKHTSNDGETCLTFEHSETICYSVDLLFIELSAAAALLAAVQPDLTTVQCVMISHVALPPLTTVLAALPSLKRLLVHIVPNHKRYPHAFEWGYLACLSNISRGSSSLHNITLHVWCSSRLATVDNARSLIAQLRALRPGVPPIEILGFSADVAASIESDLSGLSVRFDVAAPVGPLVLWKGVESYNPAYGTRV